MIGIIVVFVLALDLDLDLDLLSVVKLQSKSDYAWVPCFLPFRLYLNLFCSATFFEDIS